MNEIFGFKDTDSLLRVLCRGNFIDAFFICIIIPVHFSVLHSVLLIRGELRDRDLETEQSRTAGEMAQLEDELK